MGHREILVEVPLCEINELWEYEVQRSSQTADQDSTGEEAGECHLRGAGCAAAPNQGEVRWLAKSDSTLRCGKDEAK